MIEVNKEYVVKILRENNEGDGVGKIDNFIVFVKGALTGEIVKIVITKVNKNYALGKLISVIEKSNNRITPICPYFNECGGCDLMHMNHNYQLEFKKNKIKSIFKKVCNMDITISSINSYNELNYRNKVVFKVDNDKIGFYKSKTNSVIPIDYCFIADAKINECLVKLKKFIKENKNHGITSVMIRVADKDAMICLDKCNYKDKFIEEFSDLKSIYIGNNNVYGEKNLLEKINNLSFYVHPKSFFQVNKVTAENLYKKVISYIEKTSSIVDLYSGTGTITMMMSKKANKVIGVESIKEAVVNAKENMKLNNINNIEFICDKVENKIDTLKNLNIDVLVMDPPRSGSDKKTLKYLLEIKPKIIIYVSCNPVSLARDINTLKEKYELKEISAYDMFPNTKDIESVCLLKLNKLELHS